DPQIMITGILEGDAWSLSHRDLTSRYGRHRKCRVRTGKADHAGHEPGHERRAVGQVVSSACTSRPGRALRPLRKPSSSTTTKPAIVPPLRSTKERVAAAVPPVASTSSTTSTRRPLPPKKASACTSSVAVPYSRAYVAEFVSRGSLPALRTGTTPVPVAYAIAAASKNPRASMPATMSNRGVEPPYSSTIASTVRRKAGPSAKSGLRSLKTMPSLGKPGTSRTWLATISAISGPQSPVTAIDYLQPGQRLRPPDRPFEPGFPPGRFRACGRAPGRGAAAASTSPLSSDAAGCGLTLPVPLPAFATFAGRGSAA